MLGSSRPGTAPAKHRWCQSASNPCTTQLIWFSHHLPSHPTATHSSLWHSPFLQRQSSSYLLRTPNQPALSFSSLLTENCRFLQHSIQFSSNKYLSVLCFPLKKCCGRFYWHSWLDKTAEIWQTRRKIYFRMEKLQQSCPIFYSSF